MKSKFSIVLICYLLTTMVHAGKQDCPSKWSIHCAYTDQQVEGKWIKIQMLPRNLNMVLCFASDTALYLERDDIEQDHIQPGTFMQWNYSQCTDERCTQSKLLAHDQFLLTKNNGDYQTHPAYFKLNIDAQYGEDCVFKSK